MFNSKIQAKLENISITLFSQYLTSKNWSNPSNLEKASLWYTADRSDGLSLPLNVNPEDKTNYLRHIWNALKDLSDIEKRSIDQIINDILTRYEDKIYIRVQDESVKDGTIPLSDGVLLFKNTKNLINALALSAKKKKSFFSSRSGGKDVLAFMEQIRLGQTQVGSYIVNLCYPVENIEVKKQNEIIEAISFSRSVTHNLLNSLNKLKEKTQNYDQNPTVFASLIPEGVSHNLCDAIVGLSGSQKQRTVEICLQVGQIKDDSITMSDFKIAFTPAEIAVVETASKYYQGEYTLPHYEVIGKIVGLHSKNLSEGGYIEVPCKIDNKTVEIRIDLTPEQYQTATEAHKTGKQVRCKGQNLYINKNKKDGRLQKLKTLTIL